MGRVAAQNHLFLSRRRNFGTSVGPCFSHPPFSKKEAKKKQNPVIVSFNFVSANTFPALMFPLQKILKKKGSYKPIRTECPVQKKHTRDKRDAAQKNAARARESGLEKTRAK